MSHFTNCFTQMKLGTNLMADVIYCPNFNLKKHRKNKRILLFQKRIFLAYFYNSDFKMLIIRKSVIKKVTSIEYLIASIVKKYINCYDWIQSQVYANEFYVGIFCKQITNSIFTATKFYEKKTEMNSNVISNLLFFAKLSRMGTFYFICKVFRDTI